MITSFLPLILKLNNFIFNSNFTFKRKAVLWKQYTPLHTQKYLYPSWKGYIYSLIKNESSSYLRFINNIFMVWTKSENELKSFINEINKKHYLIKFDFKISIEKIEFLDTLVYKDHNNRLQTTLYKKPTDLQNYFGGKSAHCLSLKRVFLTVKH